MFQPIQERLEEYRERLFEVVSGVVTGTRSVLQPSLIASQRRDVRFAQPGTDDEELPAYISRRMVHIPLIHRNGKLHITYDITHITDRASCAMSYQENTRKYGAASINLHRR